MGVEVECVKVNLYKGTGLVFVLIVMGEGSVFAYTYIVYHSHFQLNPKTMGTLIKTIMITQIVYQRRVGLQTTRIDFLKLNVVSRAKHNVSLLSRN